jgi:hypothetical protein
VWFPINLLAGSMLPSIEHETVQQLARFNLTALVLASLVHLTLSLLMGLVYAALLPMLPDRPLLWGGIVAPLAWTGVTWSALGLLDPALEQHVSWSWFIASQVGFGLATGYVISRVEPIQTLQSLSLAQRAGVEGAGVSAPRERRQ